MSTVREHLDPKVVAGWKARGALAGVVISVIEDDHGQPLIVASKWAMCRHLRVDEVEDFLQRIGGAQHA
jgi:hypothetical protein